VASSISLGAAATEADGFLVGSCCDGERPIGDVICQDAGQNMRAVIRVSIFPTDQSGGFFDMPAGAFPEDGFSFS
jgi:hypothetical protein